MVPNRKKQNTVSKEDKKNIKVGACTVKSS